jgi:hypothetical protein
MRSSIIALVAVPFAFDVSNAAPVRVQMEAKTLVDLYKTSPSSVRLEIEASVNMIETGFRWANAELTENRKAEALYCALDQTFTGAKLLTILRRYVAENEPAADKPVGQVLLASLQDLFPGPPTSK